MQIGCGVEGSRLRGTANRWELELGTLRGWRLTGLFAASPMQLVPRCCPGNFGEFGSWWQGAFWGGL